MVRTFTFVLSAANTSPAPSARDVRIAARIQRFVSDSPCYRVRIDRTDDRVLKGSLNVEALLRSVRQNIDKLSGLGDSFVGNNPSKPVVPGLGHL